MRSAIVDSAMRPVVIVLLDPTSHRGTRFFQASIFRRPDFLFLQAAMEPCKADKSTANFCDQPIKPLHESTQLQDRARQAGPNDHPWKQLRAFLGKTGAPRTHVPSSAMEMRYSPKARPTECRRLGTPGLSGDLVNAGRVSAVGPRGIVGFRDAGIKPGQLFARPSSPFSSYGFRLPNTS